MTTLCYAQTKFFVRVEKSVSRLLLWIKGILLIIIKYFFSFFKFLSIYMYRSKNYFKLSLSS